MKLPDALKLRNYRRGIWWHAHQHNFIILSSEFSIFITNWFLPIFSWKLTLLWILGLLFRYCVLIPIRITIFFIGILILVLSTALIGLVPESRFKRWLNRRCMLASFRILTRAVSAVVYFHDQHNKARSGGIALKSSFVPTRLHFWQDLEKSAFICRNFSSYHWLEALKNS